jgi:Holliday junction DNA helicase RuvA
MISRVHGRLVRRTMGVVEIMTTGGVAYEIEVPLTVLERLPADGAEIELRTAQIVREDSVTLYGFLDAPSRALFLRLLTASGVGPRLALNMLSTFPPDRIVRAILERDIASLRQIPGLGTKKAERLAVEMTDRMGDLSLAEQPGGHASHDTVGALVALGYTTSEASMAVRQALEAQDAIAGVELLKAALARLGAAR